MARILVGISGWTYEGWRESFYPKGLSSKEELAYASQRMSAVEVNGTFHNLFKPQHYQSWAAQTPPNFVFAIKGPKYITHVRRLKEFETPLSNFLASGILALGPKLGPILWQFAPTMPFTIERFAPFLRALPKTTAEAARLATGYSTWLEGRTFLKPTVDIPMHHVVEGRHPSFASSEFVELMRQCGHSIVIGDTAGRWPLIEDVTGPIVYARMHGDESVYPRGYTAKALTDWHARFCLWQAGSAPEDARTVSPKSLAGGRPRDVFVFFDNDIKEYAPINALSMLSLVSAQIPEVPGAAQPIRAKQSRSLARGKQSVAKKSKTNGATSRTTKKKGSHAPSRRKKPLPKSA